MLTPEFLCRAALVQIIETAMNKEASQRQIPGHQRQPGRHTGTGRQPAPKLKLGRGEQPKLQLISVLDGKLIVLAALLATTIGSMSMVASMSNSMTSGRIHFSLKLMQIVEMQIEIDKPPSEEPDERS